MLAVGQVLVRGISGLSSWSQHCETRTVWRLSARLAWYYWAVACPINTMISYGWHGLQKKKKHSLGETEQADSPAATADSHWLTPDTHRVFHMTKSLFCHFFQCMEVKLNEATFLSTSILLRQTFVIKQHPLWSTNSPWIWSQKTFSYFLNLLLLPVRSSSQRNHRVIKVFINKCILAPFQCKHWGSKPTISVSCSKQGKYLKNQMKLSLSSVC